MKAILCTWMLLAITYGMSFFVYAGDCPHHKFSMWPCKCNFKNCSTGSRRSTLNLIGELYARNNSDYSSLTPELISPFPFTVRRLVGERRGSDNHFWWVRAILANRNVQDSEVSHYATQNGRFRLIVSREPAQLNWELVLDYPRGFENNVVLLISNDRQVFFTIRTERNEPSGFFITRYAEGSTTEFYSNVKPADYKNIYLGGCGIEKVYCLTKE